MNLDKILKTDWYIIISSSVILILGLLTVSPLEFDNYFFKQLLYVVIALIIILAGIFLEFRFLNNTRSVMGLYITSLIMLALVLVIGKTVKGATSWIALGFFSFQPSDLAKLALIILLAKYFARRHLMIASVRHILISGFYALLPVMLIILQPDFGSAMVICTVWLGLLILSGMSLKHLSTFLVMVVIAFVLAWNFSFKTYQKERILNFVNPLRDIRGSGYNAYQSIIAIGSGQLEGKGLGFGTQSRLNYLPENKTDFVYASFAEEWGFIGVLILNLAFLILLGRIIYQGYLGYSNFETIYCYGVALWFMTHYIINVGMNSGLMPVTGIPLPFMSYGGSHIIAEAIAVSMVLGMSTYRRLHHKSLIKNEFLGLE